MQLHHAKPQEEFVALVGIDWADQEHAGYLLDVASGKIRSFQLKQDAESIDQWAVQLRQQFGGRRIAVSLELTKGALVYALMKYEFITLFPVPPARLASYRDAMSSSGAKDDPTDAALILDYLLRHRDRLTAWEPDDVQTRKLSLLCEARRKFVDLRTKLSNTLKACLKAYFPQAIELFGGRMTTVMACDFLLKWPTLQAVKQARLETVRSFFYGHHCRRYDLVEARLKIVCDSVPLVEDPAVLDSSVMMAQALAKQLRPLVGSIAQYDKQIEAIMNEHQDAALFRALPGAGVALAPRLLVAFGTDRERLPSALPLQSLSGIAPVTRRSGKRCTVHRRWACPKYLRQTFHEFADFSRRQSSWAKAYYLLQRSRGKAHNAAIRALAFKWIRVIHACWKTRTPYDEAKYLESLKRRKSPLLEYLTTAG